MQNRPSWGLVSAATCCAKRSNVQLHVALTVEVRRNTPKTNPGANASSCELLSRGLVSPQDMDPRYKDFKRAIVHL